MDIIKMNINSKIVLIILLILSVRAEAAIGISNVVCQQQYPWNGKVNIEYEVYGGPADTNIWISATGCDKTTGKTFLINALFGDGGEGSIKPGKHSLVWDSQKDYPNLKSDNFSITLQGINISRYLILDFESGVISSENEEPSGGWSDEYKTTKMVLRFIQPGKFVMGSPESEIGRLDRETQHNVTITKPFYIGVFEVTQKQYELIVGNNPSCYTGDMRPVESVSYDMVRGKEKGAGWPATRDVDEYSFLGKLRVKTKKNFDIPTEAQWEYACRAGMTTTWNNGTDITNIDQDPELDKLGRYKYNQIDDKGGFREHTIVGSYLPNDWGLYDMHGNVVECCLDWFGDYEIEHATDPKGAGSNPLNYRVLRGGNYGGVAHNCRSANRIRWQNDSAHPVIGIRVVLLLQE